MKIVVFVLYQIIKTGGKFKMSKDVTYEEFDGLGDTGYDSREPVKPEDEFFHALYIAGTSRDNHIGVKELAGKLQIRGVEYNKESVNMIITHVKKILVNTTRDDKGKETLKCFSFKKTAEPPWHGFETRLCGSNSSERAADEFCKDCREQIVVAGIYCDDKNSPVLDEEKKPEFVFFRGKGMKYSNVSAYLAEMYKMEPPGIVPGAPPDWEKAVVNNKRFVTIIGMGKASSSYGEKDVFTLTKGAQLPNETVIEILRIAKQTQDKFNDKMDWSRKASATDYTPEVDESQKIPDLVPDSVPSTDDKKTEPTTEQAVTEQSPAFNFEDFKF